MIWDSPLVVLIVIIGIAVVLIGVNWFWMVRMRNAALKIARDEAAEEHYRFLRRLDHELKNPLTAMQIGLANLAHVGGTPSPEYLQIQDSIRGQIIRLNRLVSSLRKLADLEFSPIERIPLDTDSLLRETFGALNDYAESEQRNLQLTLPDELPTIHGDRDLLQLAIYNILDNAIKFTEEGDTIHLSAEAEESAVVVTVQDTGRGIDPDDLPHVLEDLYRSKAVHGIPGNGIGLALVKTIVEKHGGDVDIDSTLGEGTTVYLRLPTLP